MADNVYRILMGDNAPFLGSANINCFDRVCRGIITNTHYDLMTSQDETSTQKVENLYNFQTVDVRWIDGKPYTSLNIHINNQISLSGYGTQMLPDVGDMVIAGFMPGGLPIIIGYMKNMPYRQSGLIDTDNNKQKLNDYGDPVPNDASGSSLSVSPFRQITPGEWQTISKGKAEIYLDKNGAIKLITRKQVESGSKEFGDRLWEISCGENIVDESTGKQKDAELEIKGVQNGFSLSVDKDGNITILNNGNTITIDKNGKLNLINKKIVIDSDNLKINDNLCEINTNSTTNVNSPITDVSGLLNVKTGATGVFLTLSGQVVTVMNGIVVNISPA